MLMGLHKIRDQFITTWPNYKGPPNFNEGVQGQYKDNMIYLFFPLKSSESRIMIKLTGVWANGVKIRTASSEVELQHGINYNDAQLEYTMFR